MTEGATSATYDPSNGYVYVPNSFPGYPEDHPSDYQAGSVSVVDGTTIIATVPVGQAPYSATYDSADGDLYVTNVLSENVSVIQGTRVVATISLGDQISSDVLNAATYDSANGDIYLVENGLPPSNGTYNHSQSYVFVIRGSTLVDTIPIGIVQLGIGPAVPAVDALNGEVYIPIMGSGGWGSNGTVDIINGTTLLTSLAVAPGPTSAAYDGANGDVYVSTLFSNDTPSSVNLTTGGVGVLGGLTEIDGSSTLGETLVGYEPVAVTYDDANAEIYVTNTGSDNVTILHTEGPASPIPLAAFGISWASLGGVGPTLVVGATATLVFGGVVSLRSWHRLRLRNEGLQLVESWYRPPRFP